MNQDVRQVIESMLDKAKRSLYAACEHIEHGDYDFASSKAYYVAFHAM